VRLSCRCHLVQVAVDGGGFYFLLRLCSFFSWPRFSIHLLKFLLLNISGIEKQLKGKCGGGLFLEKRCVDVHEDIYVVH
jgi:hypothetical protein